MGAETVVLNVAAPMNVDSLRALRVWSNPVAPVIVISKASSRPAQNGNTEFAKIFNRLFTIAVDVRNGGIFANPQPSIHTRTKMLSEMSVELRPHQSDLHIRANQHALRVCRLSPDRPGKQRRHRQCCGFAEKLPASKSHVQYSSSKKACLRYHESACIRGTKKFLTRRRGDAEEY